VPVLFSLEKKAMPGCQDLNRGVDFLQLPDYLAGGVRA